ncbi:thiamine phosphate synthase [Ornithinimicrobium sp. Y1694]|uniref:thiamine phosphate synthase n=1 Tax=Ornithinimicrobium sp. Y1694 TaxID=3418590 RepID=UPI003CF9BAE6
MLDLTLYLVTDSRMTQRHGLDATVRGAVAGGASVVQLRDPDASDDEFVALGRLVLGALRPSGVPLILNDRVHLVEAVGAQGAHVGQSDLDPVEAREILDRGVQGGAVGGDAPRPYLGLSCTTLEQVEAAQRLPAGTVDYLGLGPGWATRTKADHKEPLGVEGITRLAAAATLPTVAIGGIDVERAGLLRGCGTDGIAVVSAICAAEDPESASRSLREVWT